MGEKYLECHKTHKQLDGKSDGCQEFMEMEWDSLKCEVCGCHRNFHRKVVPPEVVYTKCCKIHDFKFQTSVDGCQEFRPKGKVNGSADALTCAVCGCHKGFHRNEVTTTSYGF